MTDPQLTSFQRRVYEALSRVPEGRVTTYKALAEAVGCGSSRAIGQALRTNPFAPEVPCHRVIRSDHSIGGYSGHIQGEKVTRKTQLLAQEGVRFKEGRLMDTTQVLLQIPK